MNSPGTAMPITEIAVQIIAQKRLQKQTLGTDNKMCKARAESTALEFWNTRV
jgi:hypothetical protein